ncbi:hypothetical protein [Streptomyces cavourensis]
MATGLDGRGGRGSMGGTGGEGGTATARTPGPYGQKPGARDGMGQHASLVMLLALGLLLGALSGLVVLPAAQHLRSLQTGERVQATLHTGGSCMIGHCRVAFEADGRAVVADLPVGSGGGKESAGAPVAVRYQPDDPRTVAREADTGGGGALVLAVISGGAALLVLALSAVAAFFMARQRRTEKAAAGLGAAGPA